jgi:hypothetical protein
MVSIARRSRRFLGSLGLSISLAVLFLPASPVFAGWSMTQVTTHGGGREGQAAASTQRVWMDGSSAKVEIAGGDNPMMEPGSYLLVQDGGAKVFMVNPGRKTYAPLDVGAMSRDMESMGGSGMETRIEDAQMVKLVEEPGPEMLGHPTTHYRYRSTYTTVTSMPMGMTMRMATEIVEDVWASPSIAAGDTSRAVAGVAGSGGMQRELQELAAKVKATLVGLPLKQVTVTKTETSSTGSGMMGLLARRAGRAGGGPTSETTTVVVQDLVETTLPPSTFQIPAGYAESELLQRGPAMPDLGDGR